MQNREIILDLRRRIVSGEFAPGEPLPRRHELLTHYQTSNMTVQRAINHLAAEGFIDSRGSKGLFTSPNPPHTSRFGIVLPPNHREMEANGDTQWSSLERAVAEYGVAHPECSFVNYPVEGESESVQPEFRKLVSDLEHGLLAGAIVYSPLGIALQKKLRPYRVVQIDPRYKNVIPGVAKLFDYTALTRMAVARLKARGASKIAVLLAARTNPIVSAAVEQVMRNSDVVFHPEWIHGVHHLPNGAQWAARLVRLLCMEGMPETPDGLIILNENLLPHVVNTLGEIGRSPGKGMRIISHCNTPLVRPLYEEVDYIAFNTARLLEQSIATLQSPPPDSMVIEEFKPEYVTL